MDKLCPCQNRKHEDTDDATYHLCIFKSVGAVPVPILLGPVANSVPGSEALRAQLNSEGPMHLNSCKGISGGAWFLVSLQS